MRIESQYIGILR